MKFCVNCGNQMDDEVAFCVNCGHRQTQQELKQVMQQDPNMNEHSAVSQTQPIHNELAPKKPLSRKSKILLGAGAAVIILGFGVNYFANQYLNPQKQVLKMHEAFLAEDAETFYSYFDVPENTIGNAEQFYDWIEKEDWAEIREQMIEQLKRAEAGVGANPIDIMYDGALRMTKEDILFGLFKKTSFAIKPLHVSIEVPFAGATVTIADKKVTTTEGPTLVGDFIVGTYAYDYEFDGPYMPIKGIGEVNLSTYGDDQLVEEIDMEYSSVDLYTNFEDAIVYIDNVSTKKTVAEISRLQPVVFSDDVNVHLVAKNEAGEEIIRIATH